MDTSKPFDRIIRMTNSTAPCMLTFSLTLRWMTSQSLKPVRCVFSTELRHFVPPKVRQKTASSLVFGKTSRSFPLLAFPFELRLQCAMAVSSEKMVFQVSIFKLNTLGNGGHVQLHCRTPKRDHLREERARIMI